MFRVGFQFTILLFTTSNIEQVVITKKENRNIILEDSKSSSHPFNEVKCLRELQPTPIRSFKSGCLLLFTLNVKDPTKDFFFI